MKKTTVIAALCIISTGVFAQKKTTTSASINFDATTKMDALPKAENKTAVAAIDTKKNTIAFEALIKGFNFSNPMMQEHFNSAKWMDSEKYPSATFKGKITNPSAVKFNTDGTYTANVEGDLSIHGITQPVKTTATITVKGKAINATSNFTIKLDDYKLGNAGGKLDNETEIAVVADLK